VTADIENEAWTRISAGAVTGGPVVLAVDFDASGRSEATFRDLVKLLPRGPEVWQAVTPPDDRAAPPDGHGAGPSAGHYIDRWLALPGGEGTRVHAVLGYCAGSVYASALADALEPRLGTRPPVVVFNPGVPTVDTLSHDFTGIVDGMTMLADEERAALQNRARRIRAEHAADFGAVSDAYAALYLEACATVFERLGIDLGVGKQLTRMFLSYLDYLAAARSVEVRPGWRSGPALTARELAGTGFVEDETVLDLSRAELLRSPEAARIVAGLLAAPSAVTG
jgi:hypothetical protein